MGVYTLTNRNHLAEANAECSVVYRYVEIALLPRTFTTQVLEAMSIATFSRSNSVPNSSSDGDSGYLMRWDRIYQITWGKDKRERSL